MMEWWHAFFELVGMLAIGYIIARLVLLIPIVKKSFIYYSKKRINGINDPNPIVDSYEPEISENVISNSNPIKDFNKSNKYPLSNNALNMSATPFSKEADNLSYSKEIISKRKE